MSLSFDTRRKKKSLLTAFFIFFIDNFGFALVFPLFAPILLNPSYGILPERMGLQDKNILLGILIAAYPIAQFFGAPLFGNLADHIGRKRGFFFTMGGIVLGYCVTAIALTLKSYIFLFFGRLFTGFFAGNWSIVFATIADLSENEKERARNFGWNTALAGVSWVLSMLVGGDFSNPHLLRFFSPALAIWIAAFLSFIGFLFIIFFFTETKVIVGEQKEFHFNLFKGLRDLKTAFQLKGLRFFYQVLLCYSLGWVMTLTWINPTILEKFHESQTSVTSVLMAIGVVWGLSSSLFNPPLVAKMPLNTLVTGALFFVALFLFLAALTKIFWLFVVFYLLAATAAPLFWSNILNLISISSEKNMQGATMGIGQSVMSFGQIIAPLIAGGISAYAISGVFFTASGIAFVGFLFLAMRQIAFKNR